MAAKAKEKLGKGSKAKHMSSELDDISFVKMCVSLGLRQGQQKEV